MNKNNKNNEKIPLVITTLHKGVFFGYGTPTTEKTIRLENAIMCLYWSVETKGVLGLASIGPQPGSKLTPAVPAITLQDVTSCMEASKVAEDKWIL